MDANGNIIPLVEGDQGEGIKDPIDDEKGDMFQELIWPEGKPKLEADNSRRPLDVLDEQMLETARDNLKESLKREFTGKGIEEAKEIIITEKPDTQAKTEPQSYIPPRMRMKKGMRIHFYGYSYKVTAVRPNGKVTLRFDGLWREKK